MVSPTEPSPDHSRFNVYLSTDSNASLCGMGKLILVSKPRQLFFALYSRRSSNAGPADTSKLRNLRPRSMSVPASEGVTRFRVSVTVEATLALLHVSVFLFLAGLIVSLLKIHHIIAYVVFAAMAVCSHVYAAITVIPVICHDSPYTSPFSAPS